MARRSKAKTRVSAPGPAPAPQGGRFAPLDDASLNRIVKAAMDILAQTGIAECPDALVTRMVAAGANRREDGRVCFSQSLVETAIARAAKRVSLPGFIEHKGLTIGGGHVHIGTGGAATEVLSHSVGSRPPTSRHNTYADYGTTSKPLPCVCSNSSEPLGDKRADTADTPPTSLSCHSSSAKT